MRDEHVRGRPGARLRSYVPFYSGYRQDGVEPARHRGLPSPYLTLIFTMDDPLVVAQHPDPGQAAGRYDSLAGGLHLRPALITHAGRQSGVQVSISPLGCRALFGRPAAELANTDVDAAELLGSEPPPPSAAEPFAVHTKVRHGEWGAGTVMGYEEDRMTVLFDTVGYKTLSVPVVVDQRLLSAQ
jgi:hypothetical protein